MDGQDFRAWIELVAGGSDREASRRLGISRTSVAKYKDHGAPRYIGFACAALAFGLPQWQRASWGRDGHPGK